MTPNTDIITISRDKIGEVDMAHFKELIPEKYRFFFFGIPGFAPYRLLAYLSTQFTGQDLIEIGVHNGWGSLALSYNRSNDIMGYDIALDTLDPRIRDGFERMGFKEGVAHKMDPELILSSAFIHFDAQHDGIYERVFLDFLIAGNYKGFVLFDDIHLNIEMEGFWASITGIPKLDLTKYGHETGSGLVCFGERGVVCL